MIVLYYIPACWNLGIIWSVVFMQYHATTIYLYVYFQNHLTRMIWVTNRDQYKFIFTKTNISIRIHVCVRFFHLCISRNTSWGFYTNGFDGCIEQKLPIAKGHKHHFNVRYSYQTTRNQRILEPLFLLSQLFPASDLRMPRCDTHKILHCIY